MNKLSKLSPTEQQEESILRLVKRYEKAPSFIEGSIGCDGAIMVNYGSLWIGIEKDGYSHS